MISIPFLTTSPTAEKTFVRVYLPPTELLSPVADSYGLIHAIGQRYTSVKSATVADGFVDVHFFIPGTDGNYVEKHFHTLASRFLTVSEAEVPSAILDQITREKASYAKSLAEVEKAYLREEKRRLHEAAAHKSRFAKIFEKSRNFWRAWKGTGTPPVDPDTKVSSTDRQPPDM